MNMLRNMKFGVRLGVGFGIVLLLMTLVSIVVYTNIKQLLESSHWVEHTHEVIRVAEGVQAAMVDMETGQRGFMVTGEDEYLEPFHAGIKNFNELVAKGQALTSDNPEQGKRWAEVVKLKDRWVSAVAEPEIAARREVALGEDAWAVFRNVSARTTGKDIFDNMRSVLVSLEQELEGDITREYLITRLTLDLVNMETGQRGFLLTGKDASLEPFYSGEVSFKRNLALLREQAQYYPSAQASLTQLETLVADWMIKAVNPEISARREVSKHALTFQDVATMMKTGQGKQIMDATRESVKALIDAEEVLIRIRIEEQESTSAFTTKSVIFGTLFALLVGVGIALMVTRTVVQPIRQTNLTLEKISEGDLTQRIPVTSADEIGQMAENFNRFANKLQGMIAHIADSTAQISQASEEMATVTDKTASGVAKQKAATEQVAAAINEMSVTVQEVATNASQATRSASEADTEAKAGNQVVKESTATIEQLAVEVEESSQVIEKLKADSTNIGSVLDVIKSIAEQTNLLALNAAIEAARAGEQGRGFAVVADEVRSLAQRTQESTSEIEALIQSLQNGAEQSVDVMEHNRNKAQETVGQAKSASTSLSSITDAVETIFAMNTNIATATEKQSTVAEEIERSVENIQRVSEETALGAKRIAESSSGLTHLGQQLQQAVDQFKV